MSFVFCLCIILRRYFTLFFILVSDLTKPSLSSVTFSCGLSCCHRFLAISHLRWCPVLHGDTLPLRRSVILRHLLEALRSGAPVSRSSEHHCNRSSHCGVSLLSINTGTDEQDEVPEPDKAGKHRQCNEERAFATNFVATCANVTSLCRIVFAIFVEVVELIIVCAESALETADDSSTKPDEEGDGDVGARVNAGLPFATETSGQFGDVPDHCYDELETVSTC